MPAPRAPSNSRPGPDVVAPLLLVALVALFLFPYVFQGRSMLPLELISVFQPWASHARELWAAPPHVHNPLLDALQQYYPRRVFMAQALHAGEIPLWNPFVYGGSPFLATQQPAVLYPPAWLLSLFAPEVQFGWSALFHLSLAALGAYAFFRQVALRPAAAVVGAVAFTFNGFVVIWLAYPNVTQWTLCWLPLALFLWERGRAADDLRWIAASGLVLGLCLLGGHGQSSAYVLVAWGSWALFRSLTRDHPVRALGRWVALPTALAIGLSLGHLLPVLEFVGRTDRGGRVPWRSVVEAGMPLSQFWTFLLPRLFGDGTDAYALTSWLPAGGKAGLAFIERSFYPGASVLVLAVGAVALRKCGMRNAECGIGEPDGVRPGRGSAVPIPHSAFRIPHSQRLALFALALTAAAVLLAMGTPLYWPLWRFLPGFKQFTAVARIVCLAAWGLACLAALGAQAITDPDREVRARAASVMAVAAGLGIAVALVGNFIWGDSAPVNVTEFLARQGRQSVAALNGRDLLRALLWLIAPPALAALTLSPKPERRPILRPTLAGAALVLVVAADLFAFGAGFNPRSDPRLLHVNTPELDALRAPREPSRFLSAGPRGAELDVRQRMPSNLPATFGLADISGTDSFVTLRYRGWEAATAKAADGAGLARLGAPNLRAAAVRTYLSRSPESAALLRPVAGTAVQEDPGALPYARLHTRVEALPARQVLEALADPNRSPFVALVEGPGAQAFNGPPAVTPFQVRRPNDNRLLFTGSAPAPGLLVICEQFDPAWRARVDGTPTPLFPTDHLFLGLPLAAGAHRIELTYAPNTFRLGLFGSLLGVAWLCKVLVAGGRGRRQSNRGSGPLTSPPEHSSPPR